MKLNLSIAAAGLFVCGCVVSGEAANFDELLKKLESGRYAEREEATAALIAFVDTHWEKIEKASKRGDVERRNRLRTVMFEPTRRWLAAQLELATKDVTDAQESLKSETEKCKKAEQRLLEEEDKLEKKAQEAGAEYKKLPADADTTEATEKINRAHEAKEACVARQRVLKEEFDIFQENAVEAEPVAEHPRPGCTGFGRRPAAWPHFSRALEDRAAREGDSLIRACYI
jgi:hypothetical protein